MKLILGKKIEMSQRYLDDGRCAPVTIVNCADCQVTQVKGLEKDKYRAVQVGFGVKKTIKKPQAGHLKDLPNFRTLKEFRITDKEVLKRGDKLSVAQFQVGDKVKVTGITKGKGFQGVVKRHGFHGHPATHGHKDQLRMPGSIGAGGIQKVFKGLRMAGHMGDAQVSVRNLEVISVDEANQTLLLKGAVPGGKNSILMIQAHE